MADRPRLGRVPANESLLRQRPGSVRSGAPFLVAYSQFTNHGNSIGFTRALDLSDVRVDAVAGQTHGQPEVQVLPPGAGVAWVEVDGEDRVRAVTLGLRTDSGAETRLTVAGTWRPEDDDPPCTAQSCTAHAVRATRFYLQPGEAISGISLTYDDIVRTVRVRLNSGRESGDMGANQPGPLRSETAVPAGAGFDGIVAYADKYVFGIGLAYDIQQTFADLSGRWVANVQHLPEKLSAKAAVDAGGQPFHGNYTLQDVVAFRTLDRGRTVIIGDNIGIDRPVALQLDGTYAGGGHRLEILDSDTVILDGIALSRVQPYEVIDTKDQDFSAFGGTFDLDLQVPFTAHMFRGHDVAAMDPENLQDSAPLRARVFAEPAATSRNFYPSFQKVIPFGFLHYPDIREHSRSETVGVASAADYSSKTSNSIGISIGVPKVFSFSANESVQQRLDNQRSSQNQLAVSRDIRTERALVLDVRHVELDAHFRDRILDLARLGKLGRPIDYMSVISEFGTHYPYAMTVGTVSSKTLEFSKNAYQELYEKSITTSVSAEVTIQKKAQGGVKAENEKGFSDSFNKEMDDQTESFDEVGSEQLPVPVFYDLHPVHELLRAPFFDDPFVTDTMEAGLAQAIPAYLEQFPAGDRSPADIWEPYMFKIAFESIVPGMVQVDQVSNDPTNYYGDLFMRGPHDTGEVTVDRLVQGAGMPFPQPYMPGANGERQFMMKATELCGLDSNVSQFALAGGNLAFDFSDARDGSEPVGLNQEAVAIYFKHLDSQPKTFVAQQRSPRADPNVLNITVKAWRLPDLDGGFKEMPQCP